MKRLLLPLLLTLPLFALQTGKPLPALSLDGDEGGIVGGGAFDSDTLKGKVRVIFYVDPDEKDRNNAFSDALKAAGFDRNRFGSVAVINLDATWLPNFAIEHALKEKQKKFPDTLYVKDTHKKGVKTWQIADDASDVIVVDKDGTVLYVREGEVPAEDFDRVITIIREHLQ